MATVEGLRIDDKGNLLDIAVITTKAGLDIYALPVETFPGHINNIYFIDHPDKPTLIDVGTRYGHGALVEYFETLQEAYGVTVELSDLALAVITHAHGDHFANAHAFREMGVPLAMHTIDAYTVYNFPDRLPLYRRELGVMAKRAGFTEKQVRAIVEMPFFNFEGLNVDHWLEDGDVIEPGWQVHHVPGHSPGQIIMVVDDVVFTADHLLSRITPAQGPASGQPGMGLDNYLRSLKKLRAPGTNRLGLGGHEAPITNIPMRIDETIKHHQQRLIKVARFCEDQSRTVADICTHLFGEVEQPGLTLALSETMAHVEHLYTIGVINPDVEEIPTANLTDVVPYRLREGIEPSSIVIEDA